MRGNSHTDSLRNEGNPKFQGAFFNGESRLRNDPLLNVAQIYTLTWIEIYGDKVEHK